MKKVIFIVVKINFKTNCNQLYWKENFDSRLTKNIELKKKEERQRKNIKINRVMCACLHIHIK